MKLYSFPGSCALATHIALEWIGQPYDLALIDHDDLAKPSLRKLNPNGMVPILDVDGWVLYENGAILNYLADKYPDAKLAGDGSIESRAEVNRWFSVINSDMHPAFKPLFGATAYLDDDAVIEQTKNHAREQLRTHFERLNTQLEGREWLAGIRSIADPYLFVMLRWCKAVKVDLSGLDNVAQLETRMRADAGVRKALKDESLT